MISLRDVSKSYPGNKRKGQGLITAVDGVTLTIPEGSIFGVIGYSGAGKSTLVRLINSLEPATSGSILVDGTEVVGAGEAQLRKLRTNIGMIFQQFNLFSSRTVAGNVAFPMKIAGIPAEERSARVAELLEFVGLADRAAAYPEQLSGGQKQRVGIARALSTNPKILLADEATSALDPRTTADVLELLQRVNREFGVLSKRGVVPLAWGENGFREVSNSKHPIRTPEDMKGLKLRVVGSPLYLDTMTALGANPVQMSWADAQPAMASGAVDGQENPISVFAAAKLESVGQKHLTAWGYVADPLIFVVAENVWKSWSAEDQAIVRQAAVDAAKQQVEIARKGITGSYQSQWQDLQAKGVQVHHLSDAERQQFVNATREVYAKWKKHIGEALVEKAEQAVAGG